MGNLYPQCPPTLHLTSFPSAAKPAKIRFAVAADTPHNARTSAFMINAWVSKNFSICFQRIAALSIAPSPISSLVLIASMSDALMVESMNSINTVESHAALDAMLAA